MKTKAGLWIDHRKASIVTITENGDEMELEISRAEKHVRRPGDSPLKKCYESEQIPAEDICQRIITTHLNHYYDAVIASICEAESILIFGPGEAKGELKKRFETKKIEGRIAAVETADKMTKSQIAAKVRQYFAKQQQAIS